ncbi:MAG: hypothetical protein L0216_06425 [Planctomycetales bacterium]|nr:hypothetical protein [Planctomycetales bacterium]
MDLGTGTVRLGVRAGATLGEEAVREAVESAGLELKEMRPPAAAGGGG